jgi:hypothetical protein
MRGSRYELEFDHKGNNINEQEIRNVLRKGKQKNSAED